MNYKEYLEVKKSEGFEESILVKYFLNEATKRQKWVKGLSERNAPAAIIQKQLDEKNEFIWSAIFTGIDEKKQGWRYVEDGPAVKPMLQHQLEDIRESEYIRRRVANGD